MSEEIRRRVLKEESERCWRATQERSMRAAGVELPGPVLERVPAEPHEAAEWHDRHRDDTRIHGLRGTSRPATILKSGCSSVRGGLR